MGKMIDPIIKWSGSKRPVAKFLSERFPNSYERVFDPFVGGGNMIPYYKSLVVAGDVIVPLVNFYRHLQSLPEQMGTVYRFHWDRIQSDGAEYYNHLRDMYNRTQDALTLWCLTRFSYNGLVRFNNKGEFNTSFHVGRPGIHPNKLENIIRQWYGYTLHTHFVEGDYVDTLSTVRNGDFVFLDPPYMATKGMYQSDASDFEFDRLFFILHRLTEIGAKWMLTLDHQFDDTLLEGLYVSRFSTPAERSSFRSRKGSLVYVTDTVYTNYTVDESLIVYNTGVASEPEDKIKEKQGAD